MATTTIRGLGTGRRAAVGPVAHVRAVPALPEHEEPGPDPAGRVRAAFATVHLRLVQLAALSQAAARDVLEATAEMADDPMLVDGAIERLSIGVPPARAVTEAVDAVCATFERVGGLLADRVTDVRNVGHRVVAVLLDQPEPGLPVLARPSVVVAPDLAPADTAGLDPSMLLALVTERGGPTGHTAIIAGQLGIPCVVQAAGAGLVPDGTWVAVDAALGLVVVDPDDELVERLAGRERSLRALAENRAPGATRDGVPVALKANIGTARDAWALAGSGAQGVGLFRTEVLFLDRTTPPSVAEQADMYAEVLAAVAPGVVVVRTLDAGADKPIPFANAEDEANPALGVRGYRLVRTVPHLLDEQLTAIALAAARTGTDPWVMAPMVSVPEEADAFAARAREAGIATVGAMVEIPAAALMAGRLLERLDFVSVGTNDLAQYTLGADRLQHRLSDLLDPWQPAVLRLVAMTIAAGRAADKPVGVCGESAADPAMALVLAGLGVASLSMATAALPDVRYALAAHTQAQCEDLAVRAMSFGTAAEARRAVLEGMDDEVRGCLVLDVPGPDQRIRH